MSKKTLILSKRQLDEICGGDSSYLDGLSTKPDIPQDASNEISAEGSMDIGYPEPMKTDDYSDKISRNWGINANGHAKNTYPVFCSESKQDWIERNFLNETNSELDGQNITAVIGDGNNKQKISGSEGTLAVRKTRARQNGNREEELAIDKALKNKREPIRSRKENLKNMGVDNAFQKSGGNRSSGNGKAHTKKNNLITYF